MKGSVRREYIIEVFSAAWDGLTSSPEASSRARLKCLSELLKGAAYKLYMDHARLFSKPV